MREYSGAGRTRKLSVWEAKLLDLEFWLEKAIHIKDYELHEIYHDNERVVPSIPQHRDLCLTKLSHQFAYSTVPPLYCSHIISAEHCRYYAYHGTLRCVEGLSPNAIDDMSMRVVRVEFFALQQLGNSIPEDSHDASAIARRTCPSQPPRCAPRRPHPYRRRDQRLNDERRHQCHPAPQSEQRRDQAL